MNKTQEEFTKVVYETIKDKVFFSNISKEIADVVEKLPEEIVPGKVLFDGMMPLMALKASRMTSNRCIRSSRMAP